MVLQVVDFGCAELYILMVLILCYKTSMVLQVVDFGCAECNFQKYLRNIERVEEVSCVDVDGELLRRLQTQDVSPNVGLRLQEVRDTCTLRLACDE